MRQKKDQNIDINVDGELDLEKSEEQEVEHTFIDKLKLEIAEKIKIHENA